MKPIYFAGPIAALCLVAPCLAAAQGTVQATVGTLSESNRLVRNGWLVVKTPIILQMRRSYPVQADERAALDNYDAVLALSGAPALRADAMRRGAWLRLHIAERQADPHTKELNDAIVLYQRVLQEFPDDRNDDEVLYQLAHAFQLDGQDNACAITLVTLTRRYPKSMLTADAAFRAGELLYAQGRYGDAQQQYEIALVADQHTYVAPVRYKLAWALYKQAKYDKVLPLVLGTLDTNLPPGELTDPKAALAVVGKSQAELTADTLRLADMSFIALGGAPALSRYFRTAGDEPRYSALLYTSIADQLVARQRYADSAAVNAAFVERHPDHALAPQFLKQQIAALDAGGFSEQAMHAKAQYVEHFEPGAAYWHGGAPTPAVFASVHDELQDLAHEQHARAQSMAASAKAEREAGFADAALSYQKFLKYFPQDPRRAQIELQRADALLDGGKTAEAAQEYHQVAYGPEHDSNADQAALAEVQAYQKLDAGAAGDPHRNALLASIRASVELAQTFPNHPQRDAVIVRAAQDLAALGDYDRAIAVATPVASGGASRDAALRGQAMTVIADAYFARNDYAHAETSYRTLLGMLAADAPLRAVTTEHLVQTIYKEGQIARDAGDLRGAASAFERVGEVMPVGPMRAAADYDAGQALMTLHDWPGVEILLEGFRTRNPEHKLLADVDKLLGDAYFADGKFSNAAVAYERLSAHASETAVVRSQAAWLAAQSYDQAHDAPHAASAYATYLSHDTDDVARGIAARERLAALAEARQDTASYRNWLSGVVAADAAAGAARDDRTRHSAAVASMALARLDAQSAGKIALSTPLAAALQRRQKATQDALDEFARAAGYGFADVATAATFETGMLYHAFAQAITQLPAPPGLGSAEADAYRSALATEARPFDDKAVTALSANLERAEQGIWNDSIRDSAQALARIRPSIYDKSDELEAVYAEFR